MKEGKDSSNNRMLNIDFARGMAAFGVVIVHYFSHFTFENNWINTLVFHGQFGVFVFFALSGYVIPLSLDRSKFTLRSFDLYMLKRMLRIWIPYSIVTIVGVFLTLAPELTSRMVEPYDGYLISYLVANLTYTADYFFKGYIYGPWYTLAIEVSFYILIGLFYPVIRRYPLSLYGFVALSALFWKFGADFLPFHGTIHFYECSVPFFVGILIYEYQQGRVSIWYALPLFLILLVYGRYQISGLRMAYVLATSIWIVWVNIPNHKIFSFLGNISFSIYLLHTLFIDAASVVSLRLLGTNIFEESVFAVILLIPGLLIFSYLFYLYVEYPAILWSRKIKMRSSM
jgi:peptidoglycan/LPS O-acetylase OafA/YrhL